MNLHLFLGSSVATSMCPGEEEEKHVSILHIHKEKYKLKKIKLQTVRPFVMKDIMLREEEIHDNAPRKIAVYDFIKDYIENEMIPEAARKVTGLYTIFIKIKNKNVHIG